MVEHSYISLYVLWMSHMRPSLKVPHLPPNCSISSLLWDKEKAVPTFLQGHFWSVICPTSPLQDPCLAYPTGICTRSSLCCPDWVHCNYPYHSNSWWPGSTSDPPTKLVSKHRSLEGEAMCWCQHSRAAMCSLGVPSSELFSAHEQGWNSHPQNTERGETCGLLDWSRGRALSPTAWPV